MRPTQAAVVEKPILAAENREMGVAEEGGGLHCNNRDREDITSNRHPFPDDEGKQALSPSAAGTRPGASRK